MPVPIPNLNQLQINPPQPATARMQGMEMQNELSRIGIAKDRNAIAREGMAFDKERFEFQKTQQNLAHTRDFMPTLKPDEMDTFKDHLRKIGLDPALVDMLPSTEQALAMPPDEWQETQGRLIMGTDNFLQMKKEDADAFIAEIKEQKKRQLALEDEERKRKQAMRDFKEKEDYKNKLSEEKDLAKKEESYDKNLLVAAQAAGVDPKKVRTGNLTKEEAVAVAESYRKEFGAESLIGMLMSARVGSEATTEIPTIEFDEKGELVTKDTQEAEIGDEGQTIIRKKIPEQ